MSRFNKIILILLLNTSGILHAQTLDESLVIAAENNPGLKARFSDFEAAMQQVAQVNALPDPSFTFGYFISPVETRVGPQQAKFGLSQMFPWFGTLAAKGELATYLANAKYQEFLNAKNELYFKVKAAWYPIYEVNNIILLKEENREILTTYRQLSVTAFENGKGSMADIIRAEIMIENIAIEIKILEDKLNPLLTAFNNLLNREVTTPIKMFDRHDIIQITQQYRKDSLLANPILTAFDLRIQAAEAQKEVSRKQGLPKIGLGLDYVIIGNRTDMDVPENGQDVFMPMVSVSMPIFRRKYKAAIREAEFKQQAIASYQLDYQNNLNSTYEMTWFELDRASQLLDLYNTQIENTNQVIALLLAAYSNSGKDFEEILRMQQELLTYQIAETTAFKEYNTALAKLDYITAKSE